MAGVIVPRGEEGRHVTAPQEYDTRIQEAQSRNSGSPELGINRLPREKQIT